MELQRAITGRVRHIHIIIFQERLYIGAPGSYYWQGQTYSQNLWNRLDLIATEEGAETEDDTYLGTFLFIKNYCSISFVFFGLFSIPLELFKI